MTATTIARPTPRLLALPTWILKHKALIAFCAVVGAYYLWGVWSSGSPIAFHHDQTDYYNLLSDGFLGGHLHLLVNPDPRLLALPNPFDPVASAPYKLHDASLYHNHYYIYWGPVPALMVFIPFRILGLGDMPQTLAVFLFAFVGFCFSIAVLRLLTQRFAPSTPRWMLAAAGLALAAGNAVPFTLRRASFYEVAITAGFCLIFIAIYLLITGLQDGVRPRRLALASLFVGLAVGSRPPMFIGVIALVVLAAILMRRTPQTRERFRIAGILLGPAAAIGAGLVAYNVARFGSPLEFGTSYELAGYDPHLKTPNQVSYIPPGLWYYLLSRPHVTAGFPFFSINPPTPYPLTPPAAYDSVESVGGLFVTVPFTLLALAAPLVLRGAARRVALAILGGAVLILLMISFALWGATMRYEVDFASLTIIVAALVWFTLAARASGWWRRGIGIAGAVLISWGVAFGMAVGTTGYYDSLRYTDPGAYARLQKLTGPVPTVVSLLSGKPLLVGVGSSLGIASDTDPGPGYGELALVLSPAPVDLTIASGSNRQAGLILGAGPVPVPGYESQGPPAQGLVLSGPAVGRPMKLPPQFGPFVARLSLHRGLNHVLITAVAGIGVVTDVQLADPPTNAGASPR
jgi:hypothetical protein